jgi:hypothetical protein
VNHLIFGGKKSQIQKYKGFPCQTNSVHFQMQFVTCFKTEITVTMVLSAKGQIGQSA